MYIILCRLAGNLLEGLPDAFHWPDTPWPRFGAPRLAILGQASQVSELLELDAQWKTEADELCSRCNQINCHLRRCWALQSWANSYICQHNAACSRRDQSGREGSSEVRLYINHSDSVFSLITRNGMTPLISWKVDIDIVRVDHVGVDLAKVDLVCTTPFHTQVRHSSHLFKALSHLFNSQ